MSDILERLEAVDGVVKWFDPRKGFGFIIGPQGQDVFVHFSVIGVEGFKVLRDGTSVHYDAERTTKGWRATRAVPVVDVHVVPAPHTAQLDEFRREPTGAANALGNPPGDPSEHRARLGR